MVAQQRSPNLIDRLPRVRGPYAPGVSLASLTWFRVGGPAEVLFRPEDADDLARFLAEKPADLPVTVIGVGSNLLVRDGGVPGVVIKLGRGFAGVRFAGNRVLAGAAASQVNVALTCRDHGLGGLEFLRGVPGTIGGALAMNAGAYGREIGDVFRAALAIDGGGALRRLGPADMGFGYRRTAVPADWTFLSAELAGRADDKDRITRRMTEIAEARLASQPTRTRTGGSTFKNPPGAKAWQLIEAAGCRGLTVGDAQVSEQHCNFLINRGAATAADLEALGEEVRRRVRDTSGIRLAWEIKRIGVASGAGREVGP